MYVSIAGVLNGTGELQAVEICGKLRGGPVKAKRLARRAAPDWDGARQGKPPLPLEACSNCAGDYEDPERTAEDERTGEDDEGEQQEPTDEFPTPRR